MWVTVRDKQDGKVGFIDSAAGVDFQDDADAVTVFWEGGRIVVEELSSLEWLHTKEQSRLDAERYAALEAFFDDDETLVCRRRLRSLCWRRARRDVLQQRILRRLP